MVPGLIFIMPIFTVEGFAPESSLSSGDTSVFTGMSVSAWLKIRNLPDVR